MASNASPPLPTAYSVRALSAIFVAACRNRADAETLADLQTRYWSCTSGPDDIITIAPEHAPFFHNHNLQREREARELEREKWVINYSKNYNAAERTYRLEEYATIAAVLATHQAPHKTVTLSDVRGLLLSFGQHRGNPEPEHNNDDQDSNAATGQPEPDNINDEPRFGASSNSRSAPSEQRMSEPLSEDDLSTGVARSDIPGRIGDQRPGKRHKDSGNTGGKITIEGAPAFVAPVLHLLSQPLEDLLSGDGYKRFIQRPDAYRCTNQSFAELPKQELLSLPKRIAKILADSKSGDAVRASTIPQWLYAELLEDPNPARSLVLNVISALTEALQQSGNEVVEIDVDDGWGLFILKRFYQRSPVPQLCMAYVDTQATCSSCGLHRKDTVPYLFIDLVEGQQMRYKHQECPNCGATMVSTGHELVRAPPYLLLAVSRSSMFNVREELDLAKFLQLNFQAPLQYDLSGVVTGVKHEVTAWLCKKQDWYCFTHDASVAVQGDISEIKNPLVVLYKRRG